MFRYCDFLTTVLNFEEDGITPCCEPLASGHIKYKFNGGVLDITDYENHLMKFINDDTIDPNVCKSCPRLVTGENLTLTPHMKIELINFNINRPICNCRCDYCKIYELPKNNPYPILATLIELYYTNRLAKKCRFGWAGGEPTLYEYFDETCNWIYKKGFHQKCYSNATIFSQSIKHLLDSDMGDILISLDCGTKDKFEKVKGVDKFINVKENIIRYAHGHGVNNITLKYIIHETNNEIEQIDSFIALCKEIGIKKITYDLNTHDVRNNTVSDKTLKSTAYLCKISDSSGIIRNPGFRTFKYSKIIDSYMHTDL